MIAPVLLVIICNHYKIWWEIQNILQIFKGWDEFYVMYGVWFVIKQKSNSKW